MATIEREMASLGKRNPWLAMAVVMAAVFMWSLDSTIVAVALHPIAVDLGASSGIEWVISIYLLAVVASQPITGWLSDSFGRKPTFLVMLGVFTGASVACAASPSLGFLVFFRAVQGLGGGGLMPVGMAIALDLFPRERHGFAMATWGMAGLLGPALGPTLGGWLATSVNWHWLFLVNAPVGLLAVVGGVAFIPHVGHHERRSLDLRGLLLVSAGLSLVVLGLSEGNQWGWASGATIVCLALGAGALVGFVPHELRTRHPMLELRMFGHRAFRLSSATLLVVAFVSYARFVFIPLELEGVRGLSALRVGTLFLLPAVIQAIGMHIAGRLVDRVGARLPIIVGSVVLLIAVAGYAVLTPTTPVVVVLILLGVQGFGGGIVGMPATAGVLSDLPKNLLAQGSAVRSLTTLVGGALSVALLGALVAIGTGPHPTPGEGQTAYNTAFAVAAGLMLIGVIFACRLPSTNTPPARSSEDPPLSEELLAGEEAS